MSDKSPHWPGPDGKPGVSFGPKSLPESEDVKTDAPDEAKKDSATPRLDAAAAREHATEKTAQGTTVKDHPGQELAVPGQNTKQVSRIGGKARQGGKKPAGPKGAPPGSIAGALVEKLLAGGATVIMTASNVNDARKEYARTLYANNASAHAKLWLVPANMSLKVASGRQLEWNDIFSFPNFGASLLASFLTAVATGVGLILCFIPGIIMAFLLYYSVYFTVDKGMDGIAGMKASWATLSSHVGELFPFALTGVGLYFIGAITLIGWLVTVPLVALLSAYSYVRIQGYDVVR